MEGAKAPKVQKLVTKLDKHSVKHMETTAIGRNFPLAPTT